MKDKIPWNTTILGLQPLVEYALWFMKTLDRRQPLMEETAAPGALSTCCSILFGSVLGLLSLAFLLPKNFLCFHPVVYTSSFSIMSLNLKGTSTFQHFVLGFSSFVSNTTFSRVRSFPPLTAAAHLLRIVLMIFPFGPVFHKKRNNSKFFLNLWFQKNFRILLQKSWLFACLQPALLHLKREKRSSQ